MARGDVLKVDVTELADLADDLARATGLVRPLATGVQNKYADKIVAEAKRLVPFRTGALQRSIRKKPTGEAGRLGLSAVTIEADPSGETGRDYAAYVEFGTVHMRPRPYLRPAIRKYAAAYRRDLVDAAAGLITKKAARAAIKGQSVFRGESSFSLRSLVARNRG